MDLVIEMIKFFIYSIIIVLVSKYVLVKILRRLGELLKLKPKVVGNIAGIATSIPELLTVSFSAIVGLIGTSTYNVISSNVINLLQYGASIVLNKNQKVLRNKAIKIDLILTGITILIPIFMLIFHIENQLAVVPVSIILLLLFYKITNNAHKVYMKHEENKEYMQDEKATNNYTSKEIVNVVWQVILLLIVGIILYIIGNLLSEVLNTLCVRFGLPEMIIGILLGVITSIPELITFIESQRHHVDEKEGVVEATSNLLTSNMMNLFMIHSIGILIYMYILAN